MDGLIKSGKKHVIVNLPFVHSDAIVSQVLDELGLQMADDLAGKSIQLCIASG